MLCVQPLTTRETNARSQSVNHCEQKIQKCSKNPLYFTKRGDIIGKLLERRRHVPRLIVRRNVLSSFGVVQAI
jgi:plasmid stabilization system protein ParE